MIGVLAGEWDAAVMNMVVEVLVIDVRANMLTDSSLTDVMVGVDVDTLDDVEGSVVAPGVIE